MQYEHRRIPLSQLVADPCHLKRLATETHVQGLVRSITALGLLLHPPIVRRLPGKGHLFGVIAGEARIEALRKSGAMTVECKLLKECTDEMAEEISIRENVDRHLSQEDEERSRAALAKFLTDKEEAALVSAPGDGGKKPPGRPRSLVSKAIQKAAKLKGVSEKTIKRSMKPPMLPATEATVADADGESIAWEPLPTHEGKAGQAERGMVEELARFVAALDRFREKHLVPLLMHIPEASGQGFRFNVGAHSGVTWAHIPGTWAARTRPVLTRRKRRGDRGRQRAMPGGIVAEWNVTLCVASKKFSDCISTAT